MLADLGPLVTSTEHTVRETRKMLQRLRAVAAVDTVRLAHSAACLQRSSAHLRRSTHAIDTPDVEPA